MFTKVDALLQAFHIFPASTFGPRGVIAPLSLEEQHDKAMYAISGIPDLRHALCKAPTWPAN